MSDIAIETVTQEVFKTIDGKTFTSKEDAQSHVIKLNKERERENNLKYYLVNHNFEATEGKGYMAQSIYISDLMFPFVLDYMFHKHGKPVQPWYGNSVYVNWSLVEINKDQFESAKTAQHYYTRKKPGVTFLSNKPLALLSEYAIIDPVKVTIGEDRTCENW